MPGEIKNVQVVVLAINLWSRYTKPCLDSIKSKHNLRIFFVDNGSIDETRMSATKLVNGKFYYQRNEDNKGCSSMWNLGMKDGFLNHGMDYVFVVNNDILFHRETIDRLVEKFERADDDVVMITCNNIRSDCENMPKRIFTVNPAIYENVREDEHPDFSAFMVNRKFLEKVGEIDEGFSQIGGAWFEDNDTHRRIKLAGLRAIKLPSAIYYHYGSATSSQIGQLKHLKFESNRDYFVGKWGGMPDVDGLYQHSFNDEVKNYRWTLQSESMDKQLELVKRFRKF